MILVLKVYVMGLSMHPKSKCLIQTLCFLKTQTFGLVWKFIDLLITFGYKVICVPNNSFETNHFLKRGFFFGLGVGFCCCCFRLCVFTLGDSKCPPQPMGPSCDNGTLEALPKACHPHILYICATFRKPFNFQKLPKTFKDGIFSW